MVTEGTTPIDTANPTANKRIYSRIYKTNCPLVSGLEDVANRTLKYSIADVILGDLKKTQPMTTRKNDDSAN